MSLPSTLRPSPLGSSTPSGASTRRISALLSAVRSTTTDSPISGRSSATTFCIIAHCSEVAPAGVSQMIDHAPWVERTAPDGGFCSAGAALVPSAVRLHRLRRLGRCRLVLGKRGAEEGGSQRGGNDAGHALASKRHPAPYEIRGTLKRDLSKWMDGCPRQRPRQPALSIDIPHQFARIATGSGRPCRPSGAACTARRQARLPGRDPAATAARKNAAWSRAAPFLRPAKEYGF